MTSNLTDTAMSAVTNPILAGLTSFASTIGLATNALPVPDGLPAWVPYVVSVCGPALVAVGMRLLRGLIARKRALAEAKEARARALREDKDPSNDAKADALEDEAVGLRADADALEALRR